MRTSTLTTAFVLLLAFASSLISCQKELISANQPAASMQQAMVVIQTSFAAQHLDQKLVEQLKNSTEMHWQPSWPAVTQQLVNDSVSFFYVPLHPAIKKLGSDKLKSNGRLAASKHYLVIKQIAGSKENKLEFYSARYIFQLRPGARVDPTQQTNPFDKFNGIVLLRELVNGQRRRLTYINGIVVASPDRQQVGDIKTGARTNARNCDNYWTCIWECDNMGYAVYATTSGLNDCLEPSLAVNGTWYQIQWTIESYCYDDGSNIPPFPGAYSGGIIGSSSGDGGGEGTGVDTPLEAIVENNQLALYPPCPGLTDAWIPLINFKSTSDVINRLTNLTAQQQADIRMVVPYPTPLISSFWQLQALQSAGGLAVNLDRFSVNFTKMPSLNGAEMTGEQFIEYVRTHINDFVGPNQPSFTPSPSLPNESTNWQNHMLGTIMSINIPGDNGSVILSDYQNYYGGGSWTFSTIYDPFNGSHPVSGNRTFGFTTNYTFGYIDPIFGSYSPPGPTTYTFYIQGADRIYSRTGELVGSWLNGTNNPASALQFSAGDKLWNSVVTQVANFVNSHGGAASIDPAITNRPNWADVNNAIQNHRPLSSLPCK